MHRKQGDILQLPRQAVTCKFRVQIARFVPQRCVIFLEGLVAESPICHSLGDATIVEMTRTCLDIPHLLACHISCC